VDNVFSSTKKHSQLKPIFVIERKRNAMLGTLIKRRLSDNQVANVFVNTLLEVVDNGFKEVAALINEDPAFLASPNISPEDNGEFSLIVIVGNLSYLESTFEAEQAYRVEKLIFEKLSKIFGLSEQDFTKLVREYQNFITRVNLPSKNMVYGMSKAIFHKYNLSAYQDEYFSRLHAPNPLFLKRMDEVVGNFIWNWDSFFKKYKM
jgi:hypothetical protein